MKLGETIITHADALLTQEELEAALQTEKEKQDAAKAKLASIKERQGKQEATLEDVMELLLLVAEKVGV